MAGLFDDLLPGAKPSGDGLFDDLVPKAPEKKPLPERSTFAAINDTVIEAANIAAGGVGSIANFVAPGNRVSSFIDENIVKPGQESQSDRKKAINARLAQDIAGAQGVGDQVGAALRYAKDDPAGLLGMAAGSFAIPLGAIKGAGMLAKSLGVAEGAATKAALAGGALTGAALSGGDAAGQAYEESLKAGATEEQAQAAARQASVIPAIVGGAGGMLGAERIFAGAKGFKGNAISRALKTGASEGAQEFGEEFATQYEANRAVAPYDGRDPMQGAVAAGTLGALAGAPIGMLTGAVAGDSPPAAVVPRVAPAEVLLLGNTPDPFISFPDGTVGKRADVERYINSLPEASRAAARAKFMGLAPQKADPVAAILAADTVDTAINAARRAVGYNVPRIPVGAASDLEPDQTIIAPATPGRGRTPDEIARQGREEIAAQEEAIRRRFPPATGEATEILPTGDATELEPIQTPVATEVIPAADAQEIEPIPAGDASEEIPAPNAYEVPPVGEATEVIPTGDAMEVPRIPTGKATEIDPETVQADDLLTGDGMPYGSKTAANVRARREGLGPTNVIEIPGAGWVVRPQPKTLGPEPIQAQPAGTRGTNAADVVKPLAAPTPLATQSKQGPVDWKARMDAAMKADGAVIPAQDDGNAGKANRLRKQADALQDQARKMLEGIPAGQPVQSTRDANLREKAREKSRKAIDLLRQADELEKQASLKAPDGPNPARTAGPRPADPGRSDGAGVLPVVQPGDVAGGAAAPSGQGVAGGGAAGPGGRGGALTPVRTRFGNTVYVRESDLSGDRDRMRSFTSTGKPLGVIVRDNLDPTGEKRAADNAETADNPLFDTITAKGGAVFANEGAAARERSVRGLKDSYDIAPSGPGFVLRRKAAPNAAAPAEQAPEQSRVPEAAAPALDSEPRGGVLPPGFRGLTWRQAIDKIVEDHGRNAYVDGASIMYPSGRKGQMDGIGNVPADVVQYAAEALKPKPAVTGADWWDEQEADPFEAEKLNLTRIKEISQRQALGLDTDHMRSDGLAATGWSAESAQNAAEAMVPPIVREMVGAATASAAALRERVTDVRYAPTDGATNNITFKFDGKPMIGELRGRNADAVLRGKDAEGDRALAVRVLLDGDATPAAAPTLAERVKQRRGEKGAARDTLTATPLSGVELSSLAVASPPAPSRTARDGRMEQLDAEEMEAEEAREATIRRLTEQGVKPTRESVGQKRRPAEEGGGYVTQYQWRLKDGDDRYLELTDAERDRLLASPLARSTATPNAAAPAEKAPAQGRVPEAAAPTVGMRFFHRRVLDSDNKPMEYRVTRVANGVVYYAPVDGGKSEKTGVDEFDRVVGRLSEQASPADDYKARLDAAQAAPPPAKQGPTAEGANDEGLQGQGQGRREEVAAGAQAEEPAPTLAERVKQRRAERRAESAVPALTGIRGVEQQGAAADRMRKAQEAGSTWAVGIPGKVPEYEAPNQRDAEAFITPSMRKQGFVAYPMTKSVPPATATHKDPGQPAEPATAPVIAQALSKAAVKEALSRAAMKAEALRLVDAAIAAAPSSAEVDALIRISGPITSAGKKELSGVRTFGENSDDQSIQVKARETRDGKWTVTNDSFDGSGTGRKVGTVLGELVGTPAVARDQLMTLLRNLGPDGKVGKTDTVVIKVPGDGEFRVVNTRERLAEFRKKVEASPGFKDQRTTGLPPNRVNGYGMKVEPGVPFGVETGSGPKSEAFANMIEDGDIQAALDYAATVGIDPKTAKLPDKLRQRLDMLMTEGVTRTAAAAPAAPAPAPQPEVDAAPAAEPAAEAPALPNPWEISQDEFVRRVTFTKEGSSAFPWVAKWGDRILEAENEVFDHPDLGKTVVQGGRFSKTKREAEVVARGAHKRAVRRGVLNGNKATPEALAAYPDLLPAEAPAPVRDERTIELRKRASVLRSLRECLG